MSLELLQSKPAEELHKNLQYIEQNKSLDLVADALRPGGSNLKENVEFLYSSVYNHNSGKVREIADFVGGFEGIEKITDESMSNLGFEDVESAISRHDKSYNMSGRFGFYGISTLMGSGIAGGMALVNYLGPLSEINLTNFLLVCGLGVLSTASGFGVTALGSKLSKIMKGDQKPRQAYHSLLGKTGFADNYINLYNLMEEKGIGIK